MAPSRAVTSWLPALLIVITGLAVYANAWHGPFLLDDQRTIIENTSIRDLGSVGAVLHPPPQFPVTGRPLVNLSLALNYAWGGYAVEGYHLWNLAVHLLAGLALFGLLRRTLDRTLPALPGGATAVWPAAIGALIWVVHPLNTETVNYVTQRTESMMAAAYLFAVYAAIRGLEGPRGNRWEGCAVVAAFAAVACKETALTLPVMVVAWDRCFAFQTWTEAWARRRHLYGLLLTSWLLFAFFARELPFFTEGGFEESVSRWTYLLNQGPVIAGYLRMALWPSGLIFDYGSPSPITLAQAAPTVALVAVLAIVTLIALWRIGTLGFWGLWFFVTLAPASSLIPIPTEVGAERRMYLPLAALVALGVLAVWHLTRASSSRRRAAAAFAGLIIAGLGVTTLARNRDYQQARDIWQTVLDRRPHARAHEHMSMALRDLGDIERSIGHLRQAAPDSPNARHALGSALLERGDVTGAIEQFRTFIRLRPNAPHILEARLEFAQALTQAGDANGVVEQYRAIVQTEPTFVRGRLGLAIALARTGDRSGAVTQLQEALRLDPNNTATLVNLALLLGPQQPAEAERLLRRALQITPGDLAARKQLLMALVARQHWGDLETEARRFTALAPADSDGPNMLGVALASQGRLPEARTYFEAAVRLAPGNQQAQANLALAIRALGGRR